MRIKKFRGYQRRWKNIDRSVQDQKFLDMDYLKKYQRDYAKIWVHPWSGFTLSNSQIPEPHGTTKNKILKGLIEIYDTWKKELDKLGENYYLRICLYEPRFSNSEVVCAIGESLDFYEETFFKPDYSRKFNAGNYGLLEDEVSKFTWDFRLDEEHFADSEIYNPEFYSSLANYEEMKKVFEDQLKKPHRTTKYKKPINDATEYYSFKKGHVWLGKK